MLVYVCAHILLFSIYWSDTSLDTLVKFKNIQNPELSKL